MIEVWVMRVVRKADDPSRWMTSVRLGVATGAYQVVNGDVVEPIECFEDADVERAQRLAQERAVAEHTRTGCVHKVVMNADINDLVGSRAPT